MSMNSIGGVLDQIKFQSGQISTPLFGSFSPSASGKTSPFSDLLLNSINNISQQQQQAKQQSQDYLSGVPGVGLNDVMVSLQKSSLSLNLGVQVRNKLVSAYQDIMNMAV
ncbi:Flagellar hook-basal body complex protein FliE [Enterobacter sp. DC4]|uniref:flagellar hook-basal body complex protein FliE n=1 Tax=Enterobacter sp. DC4 TaxID=1395580 RepID=UPI0003ED152E|nr:flagellar hook-basal body complex protein FliE [Enterobacter sp. DC4]EWG67260.1 Flagellar hook-basal body complex protein FliE [Enterobacter sp. DC4]